MRREGDAYPAVGTLLVGAILLGLVGLFGLTLSTLWVIRNSGSAVTARLVSPQRTTEQPVASPAVTKPTSGQAVFPGLTPTTRPATASPEPSKTIIPTVIAQPTAPLVTPSPRAPSTSVATTGTLEGSVIAPRAFVYNAPSLDSSIIGGVELDDNVVVMETSGKWYLVRVVGATPPTSRIEGGEGWVIRDAIHLSAQPTTGPSP